MGVHHHPHVHHSKKWKNYLYEFLMLFLAVTAGFFVENLRKIILSIIEQNNFQDNYPALKKIKKTRLVLKKEYDLE